MQERKRARSIIDELGAAGPNLKEEYQLLTTKTIALLTRDNENQAKLHHLQDRMAFFAQLQSAEALEVELKHGTVLPLVSNRFCRRSLWWEAAEDIYMDLNNCRKRGVPDFFLFKLPPAAELKTGAQDS